MLPAVNNSGHIASMSRRTELGKRLLAARKAASLSQYKLADASGVSRVTINNLENGKQASSRLDTLEKLARVLGVPVSNFSDAEPQHAAARDLVDEFLASPWKEVAKPSDDEIAWLRSLQEIPWLGNKPGPEAFYHALVALRAAEPVIADHS